MAPVLRPRPHRRPASGDVESMARQQRSSQAAGKKRMAQVARAARKAGHSKGDIAPSEDEEAVEQVITDCDYWPEVCTHIQNRHANGERAPRLELTCAICGNANLRFPEAIMSNRQDILVEELTVTPCGHIFGAQCLSRWLETRFQERELPACPTCRFPLLHRNCNHYLQVRSFSSDDLINLPDDVPVIVPRGGKVSPDCHHCREMQIRVAFTGTLRLVFDNSHLTRDRVSPELRENMEYYLSEFMNNTLIHAYKTWRASGWETDEWI